MRISISMEHIRPFLNEARHLGPRIRIESLDHALSLQWGNSHLFRLTAAGYCKDADDFVIHVPARALSSIKHWADFEQDENGWKVNGETFDPDGHDLLPLVYKQFGQERVALRANAKDVRVAARRLDLIDRLDRNEYSAMRISADHSYMRFALEEEGGVGAWVDMQLLSCEQEFSGVRFNPGLFSMALQHGTRWCTEVEIDISVEGEAAIITCPLHDVTTVVAAMRS